MHMPINLYEYLTVVINRIDIITVSYGFQPVGFQVICIIRNS